MIFIYGFFVLISVLFIYLVYGYAAAYLNIRFQINKLKMQISKQNSIESFIPSINFKKINISDADKQKKYRFKNKYYEFIVNDLGDIYINNERGKKIISSIQYFNKYLNQEASVGITSVEVNIKKTDFGQRVFLRGIVEKSNVLLEFKLYKNLARIDVKSSVCFTQNVKLDRNSLVFDFNTEVNEIYQKNRQIKKNKFQKEYWLDKQGVKFGNEKDGEWLIYHTPYVSSLQLDVENKQLWINLDYYKDHPHIQIPEHRYHSKNITQWDEWPGEEWPGEDRSRSEYTKGDTLINDFVIYCGISPRYTPRLMLNPDGYLATYIWTEHADGAHLKTHKAIYFGKENINNSKEAVAGFVKHKIPVTKSVFYTNISKSMNPDGFKNTMQVAIRDDKRFLDFLDDLYSLGYYDICLHTPAPQTVERNILEESIKFMKQRFDSVTWIDHGMYNGISNLESFIREGLNSNSKYFARDLWEKYGTKYFWNAAVEEFDTGGLIYRPLYLRCSLRKSLLPTIKNFCFLQYARCIGRKLIGRKSNPVLTKYIKNGELNLLKTKMGEHIPTPMYWLHPTVTFDFYSWATLRHFGHHKGKKWDEIHNTEKLTKLIENWGVSINHSYPAYTGDVNGIWKHNKEGRIVIDPKFNLMLARLAKYRDKGNLNTTTVRDIMNYWISLKNIEFEYINKDTVHIHNKNDISIEGLSIAVDTNNFKLEGVNEKRKEIDNDIIFWFDIRPNSSVILKFG